MSKPRRFSRLWPLLALALAVSTSGCSIRRLAVNSLAGTLADGGDVFASDNDPELVADALPFALKTIEMLLAEAPDHQGLLLSACESYTSYSTAFVALDLPRLEIEDYRRYKSQRERALKLFLRARDYCFEALELAEPGTIEKLRKRPEDGLEEFGEKYVKLLYWSGASWGSAISLGLDRPELVADAPAIRALLERALELEPDYDQGALHEFMIVLEALPEAMGGSLERARQHFDRALELKGGESVSTWVSWADAVSIAQQDREEFERLLNLALAADPERDKSRRLITLISQKKARMLLDLADDLFL